MAKDKEALEKLVQRTKDDPKFFHALVFDTERTLGELDFLDRRSKASLIALNPEDVVAGLAGLVVNPTGEVQFCGSTCDASCTNTCGAGSCDSTCGSSSCTSTCGSISCGATVEFTAERIRELRELTAEVQPRAGLFLPRRRF